jgi:hypothetical protein
LPVTRGNVEIALRVLYPIADTETANLKLTRVAVGGADAIEAAGRLIQHQRLVGFLPSFAFNAAYLLGGVAAILLYLPRRDSREYLWLGLYLIFQCVSNLTFFAQLAASLPISPNTFFGDPLNYFAIVFQIEFTYAFASRPVDRLVRVYEFVLVAWIVICYVASAGLIPGLVYLLSEEIVNVPAAILLPILLLVWFLRGNREAGWLIIPSLFPAAGIVFVDLTFGGALLHLGSVPLNPADVANCIYLLAIGLIMTLRFTRISRQQARAAAELEAARTVQQILVPEEIPTIPGFSIQTAYHPAGEVGGDFYQVLPAPNGSLMAVIGDVSGKGMPAAMTVSLLVGTVRTLVHYTQDPAEILSAMNQRMIGRGNGGFTTALVLRLDRDGTLTAANAGHIAPYANGKELGIDNGLPLGITAAAAYCDTTLHLEAGTTLTLLTDGVVEAQNAKGDLFGFDRAAEISSEPAQKVAAAARTFGQQDDITVLSLAWEVGR